MKKVILLNLVLIIACVSIWGQYNKIYDFVPGSGYQPVNSSKLCSDGTFLYGTTYRGGSGTKGVVYRINTDGTGYTVLHAFTNNPDGASPLGYLVFDGTYLYGTTQSGGIANAGTIFKIKPDGTGYVKLFECNGSTTGVYIDNGVLLDGTTLYCSARYGGAGNAGLVFKINTDGTGYSSVYDFPSGGANGQHPSCSYVSDGTFLYGMTAAGGVSNLGTIFRVKPDGTGFTKMHDFTGAANGANPASSLTYDGTFLFGTARLGGSANKGVVFKINPDGTGFTKLHDFTDGTSPYGEVEILGSVLYGVTPTGGTSNKGILFSVNNDGTGFSKLYDFAGSPDGGGSYGSLSYFGSTLYGLTSAGGPSNFGTIFTYGPPSMASLTTQPVTAITSSSALGNGNLSNLGSPNATAHGMCWNTTGAPTIADNFTDEGAPITQGAFSSTLTGLISTTTYYVRAYATNSLGTTYGNEVSFVASCANAGTDTQIACDSFTWIDGNTYTASNNTATHVLTNAASCDSTVTLDLTINNSTTGTDTQIACDSFTWIDGNTYTTSNNTATHVLTNAAGCDSTVTLNLTITNSNTGTDTQIACDSFTWIDGNTYTASNNTATHVLTNAAGCDSTVTLNLTITNSNTGTDTQIACDSFTWIDGNTYTASNNTATHVLTNAAGCDSTVTLDLTINNSTSGTDAQTACDSFTWIDGNTYTASNNTATHILTNAAGCDSTVTLDLTINFSTTGTDTQESCEPITWIDGNTYIATNNTATHVLTNAAGCDSTVTLDLTIFDADATVTTDTSAATIMASNISAGVSYQWIFCASGMSVTNETNQSFTPITNGYYAVIVTNGSCTETSECVSIGNVGIEDELTSLVSIYPNPTNGLVTIKLDNQQGAINYTITTLEGKIVEQAFNVSANQIEVDLSNQSDGIYTFILNVGQTNKVYKIVKM